MTNPHIDAIDQLRDALVTLSNALASGRIDDVLAVEMSVAAATRSISTESLTIRGANAPPSVWRLSEMSVAEVSCWALTS